MSKWADRLLVHRGVAEVGRERTCLEPTLAEGTHENRGKLLHVDGAGDGAATEAQLLGRCIVVDAAGLCRGQVAWPSIRSDEHSFLLDNLISGLRRRHGCTSLSEAHYTPLALRWRRGIKAPRAVI